MPMARKESFLIYGVAARPPMLGDVTSYGRQVMMPRSRGR
jgi:hypothetical protein